MNCLGMVMVPLVGINADIKDAYYQVDAHHCSPQVKQPIGFLTMARMGLGQHKTNSMRTAGFSPTFH